MEPRYIVVGLSMAIRLKEAGWKHEDALYWWHEWCENYEVELKDMDESKCKKCNFYAAPTAETILRELPPQIDNIVLNIEMGDDRFVIGYFDHVNKHIYSEHYGSNYTLVEAAASMWLHLKENNLLLTK